MSLTIFNNRSISKKFISLCMRYKSVWTSEKIAKSPFKDIVIPNLRLDEYMFRNLDKWATKTATVCGITNRGYTYEQIYKQSRTLAANLKHKFDIQNGDITTIVLPNLPEYPIVTMSILAAGGIAITMNPVYTAYEMQRQIQHSDTKLIITFEDAVPTVKEALKAIKKDIPIITINVSQPLPDETVSYKELLVEDNHVDTSVLNEVKRDVEDVNTLWKSNKANHQDTTLAILPFFHCYSLVIQMLHKLSCGLKIVTLPRFKPDTFTETLLAHKIQLLYLAPPLVLFLGTYPKVTPNHLEHTICISSGGARLPSADIQRMFEKANREIELCGIYGMTEMSPLLNLSKRDEKYYEHVGYALPNIDLRVVDENLKNLGPDEEGELLALGPNVMKGYLNNPEANRVTFDGEWLRTGDLAKIDRTGLITISDRLKELIKVKTFQVPPAELENVLKEHPAVLDAAVLGVPDEYTGERPRAFVVLKPGANASDKEITDFVSTKVAPYKRIKQISFLDSIPKTQSGKILRKVLKEQYC